MSDWRDELKRGPNAGAFLDSAQMVLAEVMELSECTDRPVTRLRAIHAVVEELRRDQFEQVGLCEVCIEPGGAPS